MEKNKDGRAKINNNAKVNSKSPIIDKSLKTNNRRILSKLEQKSGILSDENLIREIEIEKEKDDNNISKLKKIVSEITNQINETKKSINHESFNENKEEKINIIFNMNKKGIQLIILGDGAIGKTSMIN